MATATVPAPSPAEKANDVPLMEFAVDRNQLLTEVAVAARVTDGKSTQPLLSHLLLRASGAGLLSITGSDLKRTVTTDCPAAIKTLGEATVEGRIMGNHQGGTTRECRDLVGIDLLTCDHLIRDAGNSRDLGREG